MVNEPNAMYRVQRLVTLAEQFLGDRHIAHEWVQRPNDALGGVTPLSMVHTDLGMRQVENVLGRIGFGGVS